MGHLPGLLVAQAPVCLDPREITSQWAVIQDRRGPAPAAYHITSPSAPGPARRVPGPPGVGMVPAPGFPSIPHTGSGTLARCPSQPLDLEAGRGLQAPTQGCPGLSLQPQLAAPARKLLPATALLAGTTRGGRAPASPQGRPEGGITSGHSCGAGGSRWVGRAGWVGEGARNYF